MGEPRNRAIPIPTHLLTDNAIHSDSVMATIELHHITLQLNSCKLKCHTSIWDCLHTYKHSSTCPDWFRRVHFCT